MEHETRRFAAHRNLSRLLRSASHRTGVSRFGAGIAVVIALLTLAHLHPSRAQVPDTLTVDPDVPGLDQLDPSPYTAVGHLPPEPGRIIVARDLVRTPILEPSTAVAHLGGSFLFSTGVPGWPEMWSWHGLADRFVETTWHGLPYQNLLTGRPEYALFPTQLGQALLLGPSRVSAYTLDAPARTFKQAQPLTEIRFVAGAPGMQGVRVSHGQERRVDLFGRPGLLNVTGSYAGQGVTGEYPTSYSSIRQTVLRLRYEQLHWALELQNVRARNNRGAHEGVQPRPGMDYNSIYIRFGAEVFHDRARVRNVRNDLSGTLRWRWSRTLDHPVTLSAYWTTQNMTHSDPVREPLQEYAVANRYGVRLQQSLGDLLPGMAASARFDGWVDEFASSSFLPDVPVQVLRWSAAIRDSLVAGTASIFISAGAAGHGDLISPEVFASLRWDAGGLVLRAEGITSGRPYSWFEREGFGIRLAVHGQAGSASVHRLRAEAGASAGAIDVVAEAAWTRVDSPVYLVTGEARGLGRVEAAAGPSDRFSAAVLGGWRQAAERGLWAEVRARYLAPVRSTDGQLGRLLTNSEPAGVVDGRLGARFVLFGGDLDLDVYARARGWSATFSRRFHPATGFYLLPGPGAFEIPANGTLDLYAEGGVRQATVFLSFENALAGWAYPGVIIVPDYPLPATAFRFGVYWPIWN